MELNDELKEKVLDAISFDWDDMEKPERTLLTRLYKKEYPSTEPITELELYNFYLRLKRRYFSELNIETLKFVPREEFVLGVFASKHRVNPLHIPYYDKMGGSPKGVFVVMQYNEVPILDISYTRNKGYTTVTTMTMDGEFFEVTNRDFDFVS